MGFFFDSQEDKEKKAYKKGHKEGSDMGAVENIMRDLDDVGRRALNVGQKDKQEIHKAERKGRKDGMRGRFNKKYE